VFEALIALFLEIRPLENWRKNFLEFLHVNIRVILKVLQTGGAGPQFCQNWGRNKKPGWKKYTWRKRGSNWFSHLSSFIPSFGFALPAAASLLLMFFIISKVSLDYHPANPDPMPGFIETIPSFAHFSATWKLGMKQGWKGQTRAQR
jgi:hypothetical protein